MVYSSSIELVNSDITLDRLNNVYLVDASGGDITITLPKITADGIYFKLIRIDDSEGNQPTIVTIQGNAGETINGETTLNLLSNRVIEVESYGNQDNPAYERWYQVNRASNTGSSIPLSFCFSASNGGPVTIKSSTYTTLGTLIHRGTAVDNPINNIEAIVATSNKAAMGQLRILNINDGTVIAESANFGPTQGDLININIPIVAALPLTSAIFAMQCRRTNNTGNAQVFSIHLWGRK